MVKKIKILHVVPSYYPAIYWGGPIQSVLSLNEEISNLPNYELTVLTTNASNEKFLNNTNCIDYLTPTHYKLIYSTRIFNHSISFDFIWKCFFNIKNSDIVHISATYSYTSFVSFLLSFCLNKPVVWYPHGGVLNTLTLKNTNKKFLKLIWHKLITYFLNPSTVIVSNSSPELGAMKLIFPSFTNKLISHGSYIVPSEAVINKTLSPHGSLRLVYLGRISHEKGLENLLHAMALLRLDPSISLRIYGDGSINYVNRMQLLASELDLLDKSVFFMGVAKRNHNKFFDLFGKADITIVPSHVESFGLVIAESLAHGVPVIASNNTPWKVLKDFELGDWVRNDPISLADAIKSLRPKISQEIFMRSWEYARDYLSWNQSAIELSVIYQELAREST